VGGTAAAAHTAAAAAVAAGTGGGAIAGMAPTMIAGSFRSPARLK